MSKTVIDEKDNSFNELPTPEKEARSNVLFKFGLIAMVIGIVLISSIVKGKVQLKDFLRFDYSFSFSLRDLSNSKEYIIFFIIIIPLSIYLYNSNRKWEREALIQYAEEEDKRQKANEEKKKEEFEEKMRSVHFKAD